MFQALRARQPAVLDLLLATYGREIHAVSCLILRSQADAEDVVVETLVAALEHGSEVRDEASLRAWLLRIAANRSLSARRRRTRDLEWADPEMGAAIAGKRDEDSRIAVLDGIASLPPRMRAAIVLRYYGDLTVDECADALGRSPNTVKAQLQEALDRLRSALHEDEPAARSATEATND